MEVNLSNVLDKCLLIISEEDKQRFIDFFNRDYYDMIENSEDYFAEGVVSYWETNIK